MLKVYKLFVRFFSNSYILFYTKWLFLAFLWYTIFVAIKIHFEKKKLFKSVTKKLPTKYGLPFIGIGYQFLPTKRLFYAIANNFKVLKTSTFCAWLGMNPFVITIDPEIVKKVLTSEEFLVKSRSIYTSIDNALPNGIMTSVGEKWRHNRRLLNFSFSHNILKNLIPVFNKRANETVEELKALADSREHNIFVLIKRIVLKTSVETTMGIELKTGDKIDEKLANGFNFILQEVAKEIILGSVHLSFLVHTPKYYQTIKFLREYAANLISQKYATIHSSKNQAEKTFNKTEEKAEYEVFIKQAISYQNKGLFELDDVISETHTMIAGTFDTVTTSLYSIIVLLAMHADVQEKLFNEILAILPNQNDDIDYELIKQSPYMDMVIDESLRLMPSIPIIARETDADIKLTEDILLPKGMQVMIPMFILHRRKDIWGANADAFDPENFSPEKIEQRHPFAYIPFSKGSRNCLGMRYAYIALRVSLMKLVRNFKFSTSFKYEELIFLTNLSLRYDKEPKIKIERRTI